MTQPDALMFRCPSCRTRNRIPAGRIGAVGRCGKCGGSLDTRLLTVSTPIVVTDATFTEQVLNAPLPVLLDCWAPWCSACKIITPVVHDIAAEYRGRIRVAKLNVDENPLVSSNFHIMSIPTLLVFDGGELRDTLVGALPKKEIVQRLQRFLV